MAISGRMPKVVERSRQGSGILHPPSPSYIFKTVQVII